MEHIAALIANLSQCSATLSIVCLAFSSVIRSAKRRASFARWCQYLGSLTSGAMGMERSDMRKLLKLGERPGCPHYAITVELPIVRRASFPVAALPSWVQIA